MTQFSPSQRTTLMMSYARHKGKRGCIKSVKNEFAQKYPDVKVPDETTIRRIFKKQMDHNTTHNLNSKSSPGDSHSGPPKSKRTPENVERVRRLLEEDAAKPADDATVRLVYRKRVNLTIVGLLIPGHVAAHHSHAPGYRDLCQYYHQLQPKSLNHLYRVENYHIIVIPNKELLLVRIIIINPTANMLNLSRLRDLTLIMTI